MYMMRDYSVDLMQMHCLFQVTLFRQLYLLRAPERIDFKLAVHVYSCLQEQHRRTSSMNSTVRPILRSADVCTLRLSASLPLLIVRRTRMSTVDDRSFSVAAAHVWNKSSSSCHVRTVSDCIPKSSEDLSLQSFFSVTSLYHTL